MPVPCKVEVELDGSMAFILCCPCQRKTTCIGGSWTNATFQKGLKALGCRLGPPQYDANRIVRDGKTVWLIWNDSDERQ